MTSIFAGITPYIPVLIAVAVAIAVVLIAFRVKRDGFHVVLFESADQRWRRHEDYRMSQWAQRDHQRQRFQAAMATRANNAADDRYAARNRRTPRAPVTPAATRPTASPAPDTTPAGDDTRSAPDTASPFMTVADWVQYLTTE